MSTPQHSHETTDMDPRYVLYFAIALVVVGVGVYVLVWWMLNVFGHELTRGEERPLVNVQQPTPQPQLQVNPQDDLESFRQKENNILSTYAWIDRDKGTARIPIDRAMQLFIERQKK